LTSPSIPTGSSRKQILSLAWPVILNNVLLTFVWIVDMAMVGRLGSEAVASVGLSGQLFNMVMAITLAVTSGTVALVARYTGAEDKDRANSVLGQSLLMGAMLAVPLMLPGVLAGKELFELFGAEAAVTEVGLPYLRLIMLGVPFIILALVVAAALRAAGDTKTPLVISVVANVFNMVLNYLLIFGKFGLPRLEVYGAGIATIISFALESVAFMLVLWKGSLVLSLPEKLLRLERAMALNIFRIGLPSAVQAGITQVGMLWYMSVITRYGTDPLAAYMIGVSILSLSFMPGVGFSVAASTLVGQSLGAGKPAAAASYGWGAMRMAIVVMSILGFVLFVGARQVALFYVKEESVISFIVIFVRILAICQPGIAVSMTISGALVGAADTRWPMYSSFIGMYLIRVPLALLATNVLDVSVMWVWMVILVDHNVRASVVFLRFLSGKWKNVKV
jgi:putative MATE family efflux protein